VGGYGKKRAANKKLVGLDGEKISGNPVHKSRSTDWEKKKEPNEPTRWDQLREEHTPPKEKC